MTFKSTISVNLAKVGTTTVDFASRTLGVAIEQRLDVGALGRHTAVITLDNNDGALTPGAGGTYSTVDWFSRAILIDGDTGSYTFNLCHGIITGFRLLDDGVNSYVELTTDDVFTCGGNADISIQSGGSPISTTLKFWLQAIMNGTVTAGGNFVRVGLPYLGQLFTPPQLEATNVGRTDQNFRFYTGGAQYDTVSNDFISQSLAPAGPNVIWPTIIDPPAVDYNVYQAAYCPAYPLRNTSTAITFTFDEDATTGELPMTRVERGYNIDGLINTTSFTALDDGTTTQPHSATAQNTDSRKAHGQRGMSAQAIMEGAAGNTLETIAQRWANQYADPEFTVQLIETNEALVDAKVGSSATSEQKWAQLLDVTTGICQIAKVNFTPTGSGTQQSEYMVMLGRTIRISPSNISFAVECLPLAQAGGFTLNSDVLGVLNQNRLG